MARNRIRWFRRRLADLATKDCGLVTAEYAMVALTAAAFGGILFAIVSSGTVRAALTALIQRALTAGF